VSVADLDLVRDAAQKRLVHQSGGRHFGAEDISTLKRDLNLAPVESVRNRRGSPSGTIHG